MSQSLPAYLLLSAFLFGAGIFGVLSRKNIIAVLISLELILNAANLNFVAFGHFTQADAARSQIIAMFVIATAAGEICVALSVVILFFRKTRSVLIDDARELKG
ncbi:MAG: NADH-quinone oxidoreductase subunit NuoK [Candidatus Omnitrophica bacterium]|nr:NADH-quinone oxidoreductase subunit NuoK [Candidatus Omnitrophota bacterium]